jgi:hypothetical protein
MRFLLFIFLLINTIQAQEVHIHRLYYTVNGRNTEPKICELKVLAGEDTLAVVSGKKRILLPETKIDFQLVLKIDEDYVELGSFSKEILQRGSRMSILKVTNREFLSNTKTASYDLARLELKASGNESKFEKAIIFVIESDAFKNKGIQYKKSTTGRVKLLFKK